MTEMHQQQAQVEEDKPPNAKFLPWTPKLAEADYNIYWALNPKVELKVSPIQGGGLFAKEKIYAGEIIWDDVRYTNAKWDELKGDRFVVATEEYETWPKEKTEFFMIYAYQVGPDTWFGPRTKEDMDADAAFVMNHCCDANTWFIGDTKIEARRDIEKGEELTYDYATTESSDDQPWTCECGSSKCRKNLLGSDYKIPEVRERYGVSHFVGHIRKLIAAETADNESIMNRVPDSA